MGMSTHVVGFKAPDDKWKAMKEAYDACKSANIPIPREITTYFEGEEPDSRGVEIRIENTECCQPYAHSAYCESGFEIMVAKLPKDVTHIRFYNSW